MQYFLDSEANSAKKALMRTPLDGARISSVFGNRKHPILGYTKMHKGVDFAAPRNTPVFAAGDGIIEYAKRNGGYGKYIRIRHNRYYKKAYDLIDNMGSMMKNKIIGGQIIYSITDDNWSIDNKIMQKSIREIEKVGAQISIYLGGYLVIGAEQKVLNKLLKSLPKNGKYPFQLPYHAAFHTPLLESISQKAKGTFSKDMFLKPQIPIIDGRGHIWSPWSTNETDLWNYTLGHQLCESYNFSKSLSVAIKEFAPDKIVLLGPGNTLGGPIGQIICQLKWRNISSKDDFSREQKENPFLSEYFTFINHRDKREEALQQGPVIIMATSGIFLSISNKAWL